MATSERNDQAEIPTSQGQQKRLSISEILGTLILLIILHFRLDLNLLSSSVNVSSPEDRVRTTSNSERPLKVPTEIVNDNNQLQGTAPVSQHEGPSGATTQHTSHHVPTQNPIIPCLESMPIIQGTEETTSERSLMSGTQLESPAVLISEHDLPHDLLPPHGSVSIQEDAAPLEITGEPHGILISAAPTGTGEQSSRKGLLKGKILFCFAFPPALTLRIRCFP
jgi:hypothetical protein